jgi:hypothetical protein
MRLRTTIWILQIFVGANRFGKSRNHRRQRDAVLIDKGQNALIHRGKRTAVNCQHERASFLHVDIGLVAFSVM